MKVELNSDLHVTAQAENEYESSLLLILVRSMQETKQELKKSKSDTTAPATVKSAKRKKPLHKKKCPLCGQVCVGNSGLGIHMRKMHGISFEEWESRFKGAVTFTNAQEKQDSGFNKEFLAPKVEEKSFPSPSF